MSSLIRFYNERLMYYEEEFMEDLASLVAIRSVRDEETKAPGAPFGEGIRNAFDQMTAIANRDGFETVDFDGYAMHIEHGEGDETVGVLAHLDIVPEGDWKEWGVDPFTLTRYNGHLYGRGVNDDKAPALAAYYALKILRDMGMNFHRKVRIILGGAEETTWECMDHYFKHNEQPTMAFSPDGDFPIVNGEKGVVQGTLYKQLEKNDEDGEFNHQLISIDSEEQRGFICEYLKVVFKSTDPEYLQKQLQEAEQTAVVDETVIAFYKGEKALSRNPHKGENAIFKFSRDLFNMDLSVGNTGELKELLETYFHEDIHGKNIGLFLEDEEMGITTFSIPYLKIKDQRLEMAFDYRFPKGQTVEGAIADLTEFCQENGFEHSIYKTYKPLFVPQDSTLIKTLQRAYKNVTGETPECMTKGGISYSRALDNCVAFGPTMPGDVPNTHKANERIRLKSLHQAIIIYCETIRLLATIPIRSEVK